MVLGVEGLSVLLRRLISAGETLSGNGFAATADIVEDSATGDAL